MKGNAFTLNYLNYLNMGKGGQGWHFIMLLVFSLCIRKKTPPLKNSSRFHHQIYHTKMKNKLGTFTLIAYNNKPFCHLGMRQDDKKAANIPAGGYQKKLLCSRLRPLPTCQVSAEGLPTPLPCSKSQFYEKQNNRKGRICKRMIPMMCLGVQEQPSAWTCYTSAQALFE